MRPQVETQVPHMPIPSPLDLLFSLVGFPSSNPSPTAVLVWMRRADAQRTAGW